MIVSRYRRSGYTHDLLRAQKSASLLVIVDVSSPSFWWETRKIDYRNDPVKYDLSLLSGWRGLYNMIGGRFSCWVHLLLFGFSVSINLIPKYLLFEYEDYCFSYLVHRIKLIIRCSSFIQWKSFFFSLIQFGTDVFWHVVYLTNRFFFGSSALSSCLQRWFD